MRLLLAYFTAYIAKTVRFAFNLYTFKPMSFNCAVKFYRAAESVLRFCIFNSARRKRFTLLL